MWTNISSTAKSILVMLCSFMILTACNSNKDNISRTDGADDPLLHQLINTNIDDFAMDVNMNHQSSMDISLELNTENTLIKHDRSDIKYTVSVVNSKGEPFALEGITILPDSNIDFLSKSGPKIMYHFNVLLNHEITQDITGNLFFKVRRNDIDSIQSKSIKFTIHEGLFPTNDMVTMPVTNFSMMLNREIKLAIELNTDNENIKNDDDSTKYVVSLVNENGEQIVNDDTVEISPKALDITKKSSSKDMHFTFKSKKIRPESAFYLSIQRKGVAYKQSQIHHFRIKNFAVIYLKSDDLDEVAKAYIDNGASLSADAITNNGDVAVVINNPFEDSANPSHKHNYYPAAWTNTGLKTIDLSAFIDVEGYNAKTSGIEQASLTSVNNAQVTRNSIIPFSTSYTVDGKLFRILAFYDIQKNQLIQVMNSKKVTGSFPDYQNSVYTHDTFISPNGNFISYGNYTVETDRAISDNYDPRDFTELMTYKFPQEKSLNFQIFTDSGDRFGADSKGLAHCYALPNDSACENAQDIATIYGSVDMPIVAANNSVEPSIWYGLRNTESDSKLVVLKSWNDKTNNIVVNNIDTNFFLPNWTRDTETKGLKFLNITDQGTMFIRFKEQKIGDNTDTPYIFMLTNNPKAGEGKIYDVQDLVKALGISADLSESLNVRISSNGKWLLFAGAGAKSANKAFLIKIYLQEGIDNFLATQLTPKNA